MEQAKPKAIDGQKKFTATLAGFVMSFLNSLVTTGILSGEAAEPLTQLIAIAAPIVGAFAYDLIQGSHDKKKLETEKGEIEKRYLLPETPAPPAPLPKKPKRVDFRAFTDKVLSRLDKDDHGNVKAYSLYQALRDEGDEWDVEVLSDVFQYARLVSDAAERKFEELNGFSLNDPDLPKRLRTVGKCPYATVEAFCAYEGNAVALRDVYEARQKERDVDALIKEDLQEKWKEQWDTSLFSLWNIAYLIRQDIARGGRQ